MGIRLWVRKKLALDEEKKEEEELSELKKTLEARNEQINQRTVTLSKLEAPEQSVYSPAVEHPLLTIQEKISRLEEIYNSINDKLMIIDGKVADKRDIEEIKSVMNLGFSKNDQILLNLNKLGDSLINLNEKKEELTEKVDTSTHQLTQELTQLNEVRHQIDLLESHQKILNELKTIDLSTIDLSERLGYSRQYVWERMKELEEANLVERGKEGRKTIYTLTKNA